MNEKHWFSMTTDEVAEKLEVDLRKGLAEETALARQKIHGLNALEETPPKSLLSLFVNQLKEILVVILIVAALISGALGEWIDSIVIMVIVVLNAGLGVFQEHKAEESLKALKKMTKAMAKVYREGVVKQIEVESLVPGDIILLEAGDSVPADLRILESASLMANESALTGESLPVEKHHQTLSGDELPIGEQANLSFMGTYITAGRGKGIVVNTGMKTQLGKIAELLKEEKPNPTPLQRELARLGKVLGIAAGVIVVIVFLAGIFQGEEFAGMFMVAIALAVAAIPEGLPAVVTIVLALGVTRMSKRQAVIRKLPAVETLGVATYICSDKTGTLTKNEMTVVALYLSDQEIQITGTGYRPEGAFLTEENQEIEIKDQGDLQLLLLGGGLNTDARLVSNDKGYEMIGDPTEGALVVAAAKGNLEKEHLESIYPRLAEIPFDSTRKMMTTFHTLEEGLHSFTKGAPDIILERCSFIRQAGKAKELEEAEKKKLLGINFQFASRGRRVLALAYRVWPELPKDLKTDLVEQELVFVGYFVMIDPPRPEVGEAVKLSQDAGINVVMITGDHRETALAIAKELGIWKLGQESLTGAEINNLTAEELRKRIPNISVCARVSPEDKLKIVDALKANGQVVAMTGDGVNDAPALKRADIGAAMGITGTEVSKEAADMVLLDDNFATIVNAVEEGRTIYSNIRKVIYYLLSCNIGEIIAIFGAILLGLGSPLTPIQILWLNLVTDGSPALALGLEPAEKGIMHKKPRKSDEGVLAEGVGQRILFFGTLIGLLSLGAYWLALNQGRSLAEAHTMAFLVMAFSQLLHSFNARNLEQSIFKLGFLSNRSLAYAFFFSIVLQLLVVFVSFLREVFHTSLLGISDWGIILTFSIIPLVVGEIGKLIKRKPSALAS